MKIHCCDHPCTHAPGSRSQDEADDSPTRCTWHPNSILEHMLLLVVQDLQELPLLGSERVCCHAWTREVNELHVRCPTTPALPCPVPLFPPPNSLFLSIHGCLPIFMGAKHLGRSIGDHRCASPRHNLLLEGRRGTQTLSPSLPWQCRNAAQRDLLSWQLVMHWLWHLLLSHMKALFGLTCS